MEVQITLTAEEVKAAVKSYINTQGMSLIVKEVSLVNGEAVAICEKVRQSVSYLDR